MCFLGDLVINLLLAVQAKNLVGFDMNIVPVLTSYLSEPYGAKNNRVGQPVDTWCTFAVKAQLSLSVSTAGSD